MSVLKKYESNQLEQFADFVEVEKDSLKCTDGKKAVEFEVKLFLQTVSTLNNNEKNEIINKIREIKQKRRENAKRYPSLLKILNQKGLEMVLTKFNLQKLAFFNPMSLLKNDFIVSHWAANKRKVACAVCLAAKMDFIGEFVDFSYKLIENPKKENKAKQEKLYLINTRRGGFKAKKRRMNNKKQKTIEQSSECFSSEFTIN
ncbi:hypothetical protein NUSPORA_00046 [Nucleospora cyclopteri]